MLILVEGPDCVGKTTMVERLQEHMSSVTKLSRGALKSHPLLEYERALDFYEPGVGLNVLCDRWHIGEKIYGPIKRGRSEMDAAMELHIDMYLASRGALLVYLDLPEDTLLARWDESQYPTRDELVQIRHKYHDAFHHVTPVGTIRVHNEPKLVTDDTIKQIIVHATDLETRATFIGDHPHYVGTVRPKVLLLGEVRGPQQEQHDHAAAFVPYPSTSGHFLLEACPWLTIGFAGIANACEPDHDVVQLWSELGTPVVCALGQAADRKLHANGVPHGAVPHPQFVRRFHYGKKHAYGSAILEAAAQQREYSW